MTPTDTRAAKGPFTFPAAAGQAGQPTRITDV